ncbi:MAG: hypothetical protein C0505_10590 [Leptothrix sp. (in: Bacteria)]|nr:hypothetical protein [Leptothrix sp. (in: b-proteobacteria)]
MLAAGHSSAAPRIPTSDAEVLATVPARASDPRARELAALRSAWRVRPQDEAAAVALAQRYFEQVAAEGDPRYIGYAQAALQPWWDQPQPPAAVRVLRGKLRQFDHQFDAALADLDATLREQPANADAWAWRLAILLVSARYDEARAACERLVPLVPPLIGAGCRAQVDALTGHAGRAAATLQAALTAAPLAVPRGEPVADAPERLWALTRLAEIEERRGAFEAAEAAFRQALALGVPDVYLQAAYADFLLDRGRAAEVLSLLKDSGRADVLLLRLALAAKATGDARAPRLAEELAARFEAARLRGDTSHEKEESRFLLALRGDTARALVLARQNFAVQREPADARVLLEAAIAARDAAAAAPAMAWMSASRIESVSLQALVARVKALS